MGSSHWGPRSTAPGIFDYPIEADEDPSSDTAKNAAVVNLFYMNNWLHDWWYNHGFDEAAGNAQASNYERTDAATQPTAMQAGARRKRDRKRAQRHKKRGGDRERQAARKAGIGEQRPPGVDQRPHIADEGRDDGEPDPPDDPDRSRGEVLHGMLVAEEAGRHHQGEQQNRGEPEQKKHNRVRRETARRVAQKIEPRIGARPGDVAQEDPDHHEGESNRGSGARQVQAERHRQVVALAEGVGAGGRSLAEHRRPERAAADRLPQSGLRHRPPQRG